MTGAKAAGNTSRDKQKYLKTLDAHRKVAMVDNGIISIQSHPLLLRVCLICLVDGKGLGPQALLLR